MNFPTKTKRKSTRSDKPILQSESSLALKPENEICDETIRNPYCSNIEKNYSRNLPRKPINIAVTNGNTKKVLELLNSGINPEEEEGYYGNSGMHWAVKASNIEVLELYRERGLDVSVRNNFSWTPLHSAAEGSHLRCMVWLLDNGAEVDPEDSMMQTPLSIAAFKGHTAIAKLLIERGADIKHTDYRGRNFLHIAKTLPMLELLLQHNVDIDGKDYKERTPLHYAACTSDLLKASFLIEKGADTGARNRYGCTPYDEASRSGDIELVKIFLDKGANHSGETKDSSLASDIVLSNFKMERKEAPAKKGLEPNVKHSTNITSSSLKGEKTSLSQSALQHKSVKGNCNQTSNQCNSHNENEIDKNSPKTPLNLAVVAGNTGKVRELLNSGINPEEKDGYYGNSGMHWAVKANNIEVLELYRERGLDVSVRNNLNWTPLHIAAEGCRRRCLIWLLDNGADVDEKDSCLQTPLTKAIFKGHIEIAKILHERGADLKSVDSWSKSYLHYAKTLPLLEWLLENDLDVNIKDDWGTTPLHDCVQYSHLHKASFLLEKGANVEAKDRNGCTPLYEAARFGRTELVRLFLSWGADPESIAKDGSSPMTVARDINIKTLLLLNDECLDKYGKKNY